MQWLIWIMKFLFQMQNSRIQKFWLCGCIRNSLMLRNRAKSDRFPIKMNQDFHLRAHLKVLFYTQVATFKYTLKRTIPVWLIIFPFHTKQFQIELTGNKSSISLLVSRLSYLDYFPEESWITTFFLPLLPLSFPWACLHPEMGNRKKVLESAENGASPPDQFDSQGYLQA